MAGKKWYDEERELPSPWEWVIVVLFSAAIIGYGLLVYGAVSDGARFWDFGQLPDTPAESIYSTEVPGVTRPNRQLPPLPEAQRGNRAKSPHENLRERGPKR